MLPKLKRLVSSEDPRTLDSYFVEGLARTLEKKAKINAMDSELGIELLLLAGWLRGPRTPREGEDHPEEEVKKAFMNLKALVPTYEAE
ncbi:MAG: hypothetical protein QOE22_724 [Candidatus Parcubacteria bacterium]|jgi:hypothetical protein|nr:hypothetical protein [Candidatus Parcubacteria bacterium]